MCGIVALWHRDGTPCDAGALTAMRDRLTHRGPDDFGAHVDGGMGLGHRRLSIVDLSAAGHQPMCNEDGSVWLVFNGEIYNYIELAAELRARGHQFRSSTDSEVIVHLYEEMGVDLVQRLNGMFAFVIWDAKRQRVVAARDRIGIKPLYYAAVGERWLFASETKAILSHPSMTTAVDPEGLADYLFAGAPLGEKTMFRGVRQLPPAHVMVLDRDTTTVRRYWDVAYNYRAGRPREALVADLTDLIDDAVRIHCRSDARLGCHLSGGLDSSLVSALAARHRGAMDAFSVRFGESTFYDEVAHAAQVASAIGARHHVVEPSVDDLWPMLGPLTWHQDFPLTDAGGFSYFSVSRLAASHVTVAMTGHGGDEVFGGYPAQFATTFGSTSMFDLSTRPRDVAAPAWKRLVTRLRRRGVAGLFDRRGRGGAPLAGPEATWVALHCGSTPEAHPFLHRRLLPTFGGYSPVDTYLAPFRGAPTSELFDRCLYHDLVSYLPHLLMKEDRASMAVSIESRVPLLDYRIVEFMATVPPAEKVPDRVPKALLRDVARQFVPARVVDRNDKTPFPIPLREWIASRLAAPIRAVLSSERSLDRGIFDPRVLRDPGLTPAEMLALLNVEIWFRVHIDGDPAWRPATDASRRGAFATLPALVSAAA